MKLVYAMNPRPFGKVLTPIIVMCAALPLGFGSLWEDQQARSALQLPVETAVLIREQVARITSACFGHDIGRWNSIQGLDNAAKFDALAQYAKARCSVSAERPRSTMMT